MKQGRTQGYFPKRKAGTGVGIPAPRANVVSEVRADPGAGSFAAGLASLANGFTNYFTEQTQVELAKSQDKAKKQAVMDAQQAYESGVTSVSSEITKEYKGTYADAYSSALGSLRARDAEKQFASFVVASDIQPHEILQTSKKYNEDNFENGTGNLNFDSAFQKSWTAYTEKLRHTSSVAAAQKIKETARLSVNQGITNFSLDSGTPSHAELMDQVNNVRSVYRGFTEGKAISHVFGLYQFQATQSLNGAIKYLAMLDQPIIPDNSKPRTPDSTTPTTSFSKLFPRESMEARQKTMKIVTNIKTVSGQQKVTAANNFVSSVSTNIQEINSTEDFNDIEANLMTAASTIAALKNATGVPMQSQQKLTADLAKAQTEYINFRDNLNIVAKVAVGGRGDALEAYRGMEAKEQDKAVRVYLGTGDLSDVNYYNKFTNAFRNFGGLEEKTPEAFLDIIREQFISGDRNTKAGVVAFANTLDLDGSIGAAAFKNDAGTAVVYEQARIVGIDAAVDYRGNDEYNASIAASAKAGGLAKILYPDEKPQKAGENLSDWYTEVGNALDNQMTGGSGKPLSQNFKDDINKVLPILKARLEAQNKVPSPKNLKEAITTYYQPRTLVGEQTIMLALPNSQRVYAGQGPRGSRTMPPAYFRGSDPKFLHAYIGTYVKPSDTSPPQDTFGNMIESVKKIRISGVDGDVLSVSVGTGEKTGFGVIRSSKSFGAPVVFNAGQVLKEPRGKLQIGRGPTNKDYVKEYKFTGDYLKDQAFVNKAFGSEYQLLPITRGSYQLVILPFFKGIKPMEAMVTPGPTPADIERRAVASSTAGAPIPLVPSRDTQAGEGMTP